MVRGQLQRSRSTRQPRPPVREPDVQQLASQPLPLPRREVHVLHRQLWQRRLPPRGEGGVQLRHLAHQHPQRATVRHQVVQHEQQRMLALRQVDEQRAQRRTRREVEGPERLLRQPPLGLRRAGGVREGRQVHPLQHQPHLGGDALDGGALLLAEGGAEDAVAPDDLAQAALQHRHVQRALHADHHRVVVGGAAGFELLQEPQPLLREGQRQRALARAGNQRGDEGARAWKRVEPSGDGRWRAGLEQLAQGQVHTEGLTEPRRGPGGEQRVPAQREEVVLRANALHAQQRGPQLRDTALRVRPRNDVLPGRLAHVLRCGERLAVHLAVRRQRKRAERHDGGGHQVHGERPPREGAQRLLGEHRTRPGHHVRHEPRPTGHVLAGHHHRLRHVGVPRQRGLDFRRLHPEPADLELVVHAAQELHRPIRTPARLVSRPVHPRTGVAAKRVRHEALGRQLRSGVVATRHTRASNEQLAGHADGRGPQLRVQDVERGVGDGRPDGNGPRLRAHAVRGGPDGGLRGAVHVEECPAHAVAQPRRQLRRERLTAHQQSLQARERARCIRLQQQCLGQRGCHLQVCDAVPPELRGHRPTLSSLEAEVPLAALPQGVQRRQAGQHGVGVHAEVDEARHLVHAERIEARHLLHARARGAEQAAAFEEAPEGTRRQDVQVLRPDGARLQVQPERAPQPAHQVRGAAEVAAQRRLHRLAHPRPVMPHEGVEHQRHMPLARVARLTPGLAIYNDTLAQLLPALAEQVRQHARAQQPCFAEGGRVARGGEPDGQLPLHGGGTDADVDGRAQAIGQAHGLAPPEPPHEVQAPAGVLPAVRVALRREHEVLRVPSRSHGESHAPVGQVVDEGPLLGDAHRVVQRKDDTAGTDGHALGDGGHRRARQRGVGVEPAKGVEVSLGRPHRLEAMAVREARALHQQSIPLRARSPFIRGEVEEAEAQGLATRRRRTARSGGQAALLALHGDLEATRQRPEQLQHGDVEGHARHREPRARRGADAGVHSGEEADHVAVGNQHALGAARRAGRVEDIREVVGPRSARGRRVHFLGAAGRVQQHHGAATGLERGSQVPVREHHVRRGVLQHEREPRLGVGGVQRQVRAARLEDAEQSHHQVHRAVRAEADDALRPHALLTQPPRHRVGPPVQRAPGEGFVATDHGQGVWRARGTGLDEGVDARIGEVRVRVVPVHQHAAQLRLREERERGAALVGILDDGLEQHDEPPRQSGGGGGVEELRGVFEPALQPLRAARERERQVIRRGAGVDVHTAGFQAGQRELRDGLRLEHEQHLEQRRARAIPRGLDGLHQSLEGHASMRERVERDVPRPPQQLAEGGRALERATEDEQVEEAPDQPLQPRPFPSIDRSTDAEVLLPRVTRQQHLEGRQQRHEERGALAPAERLQPHREVCGQVQRNPRPPVGRHRRARVIHRKLQGQRRPRQPLLPPLHGRGARGFLVPLAAPAREVGILEWKGRQRSLPPRDEPRVEGAQLARQDGERGAIRDEVVHHHDEQGVVRVQADQREPAQRAIREVEGRAGLFPGNPKRLHLAPGRRSLAKVHPPKPWRQARKRDLRGRAVLLTERGAQGVVPARYRREGRLQRLLLQCAAEPHRRGQVVRRVSRLEPLEQPQSLLGGRERRRCLRIAPDQRRKRGRATGLEESARELGHRRPLEQYLHPEDGAQGLQVVRQLDGAQRVQAEGRDGHVPRERLG